VKAVSSAGRLVDELCAHLAIEYAGAVAPGRILAFVVRAERGLRGLELELGSRLDLIESSVRRQLAHVTARPVPEQRAEVDSPPPAQDDVRP
jgi:hypothetical protein